MANDNEYIVDIDVNETSNTDLVEVEIAENEADVSLNDDYTSYRVLKSYNALTDKPTLNGQTIIGDMTVYSDRHYLYTQETPSTEWTVEHNLNKYPAVTVVDSAGNEVEGLYNYVDLNTVVLTFSVAFAGKAFFN